jgi:hypothetical protein
MIVAERHRPIERLVAGHAVSSLIATSGQQAGAFRRHRRDQHRNRQAYRKKVPLHGQLDFL